MSAASCNYGNGWKTFGVERVRSCWRQGKLRVDTSFSFSSPSSSHQLKSCRFILIFPNNSLHHLSRGFYQKVSQPRPRRRRRRRLAMERLGGETGETLYEAEDSTQSERAESLDTHTHRAGEFQLRCDSSVRGQSLHRALRRRRRRRRPRRNGS